RAENLRAEVHHEPHAEPGGAVRVVRARDVALQRGESDVMVARVLAADLVHQDVAARLERAADGEHALVDPGQLPRRIAGALDVESQQADVAAVLRVGVVDLRAPPEPRLPQRGAGGLAGNEQRGRGREQDRPFHLSIISAAEPSIPVSSGTTSSRSTRAQYAMSSSRPGGP